VLNILKAEIIPEKQINTSTKTKFHQIENHNLALAAAKEIGLNTINLGQSDLMEKKPYLILGLIRQIVMVC
jgi:hypothetical protein